MRRLIVPTVLVLPALVVAVVAVAGGAGPSAAQGEVHVFLPVALRNGGPEAVASVEPVPTATGPAATIEPATPTATTTPTATAEVLPTETEAPEPTGTIEIPPTMTPEATATPTGTAPAEGSLVHGRIRVDGRPIAPGYGLPGGPQIELRRCTRTDRPCLGDEWEAIDRAVVADAGYFEFRNPPPLAEGERYQVWWVNDFEHVDQATGNYLGRWWSNEITTFGAGSDVDVGVFEVADLKLREICHDCLQSLPITFKWAKRSNRAETYRWSLFRGCGSIAARYGAWRTADLAHSGEYTLSSPPPGYRLNEKYCWYVFITNKATGTGWSFDDWRVTFLPTPGGFTFSPTR